jgi:hypothetical protein
VQPGSSASGAEEQSIDLTKNEVEFAQRLGPLVHSPRAAKRLMNTYRLVRATQHAGSRSRFLGSDGSAGEYQAVLTLLAAAAGYPTMADRLLVALEDDAATRGADCWSDFVAALDPAGVGGSPGALVPADLVDPSLDDAMQARPPRGRTCTKGYKPASGKTASTTLSHTSGGAASSLGSASPCDVRPNYLLPNPASAAPPWRGRRGRDR